MYTDAIVIAGIVAVLMVLGFFVGIALFVIRDQRVHGQNEGKKMPSDRTPI